MNWDEKLLKLVDCTKIPSMEIAKLNQTLRTQKVKVDSHKIHLNN